MSITKISKTKMIYIAVLLVALAVLAWDKTSSSNSLTNPKPGAAAQTRTNTNRLAPVKHPSAHAPASDPVKTVADQAPVKINQGFNLLSLFGKTVPAKNPSSLATFMPAAPRDLFAPSAKFRQLLDGPREKDRDISENTIAMNLSACLVKNKGGTALINGEIFTVGDQIDRFKLIAVHHDRVILSLKNRKIALFFDQPSEIVP